MIVRRRMSSRLGSWVSSGYNLSALAYQYWLAHALASGDTALPLTTPAVTDFYVGLCMDLMIVVKLCRSTDT